MKTTTSAKLPEKVHAALIAVGYISLVMALTYIGWFAGH